RAERRRRRRPLPGAPRRRRAERRCDRSGSLPLRRTGAPALSGRGPPMSAFDARDRVRVKDLPRIVRDAGTTGAVVRVISTALGKSVLLTYRVRLNHMAAGSINFSPHELEPEPGQTP